MDSTQSTPPRDKRQKRSGVFVSSGINQTPTTLGGHNWRLTLGKKGRSKCSGIQHCECAHKDHLAHEINISGAFKYTTSSIISEEFSKSLPASTVTVSLMQQLPPKNVVRKSLILFVVAIEKTWGIGQSTRKSFWDQSSIFKNEPNFIRFNPVKLEFDRECPSRHKYRRNWIWGVFKYRSA